MIYRSEKGKKIVHMLEIGVLMKLIWVRICDENTGDICAITDINENTEWRMERRRICNKHITRMNQNTARDPGDDMIFCKELIILGQRKSSTEREQEE